MSLDNAVENLSSEFGVPVVVVDRDWHVAAAGFHDTEDERLRLSMTLTIGSRALADSLFRAQGTQARTEPLRVPADRESNSRVIMPLRHERQLAGYLTYLEDVPVSSPVTPHAKAAVDAVADELGLLVTLRGFEMSRRADTCRRLVRELLGASAAARSSAADQLLDAELISDSGECCVLLYRTPRAKSHAAVRLGVERTLDLVSRSTTVRVAGAVLGEEGILVFPRPVQRRRLLPLLEGKGMESVRAGVGSVKESLVNARESYKEAQIAWRAAVRDRRYGRAAFWDDLGIDRLLLQLPLQTLTVTDFPPDVQRLLTLPECSDLLSTLETYLETGGNAQQAARALHIHRATLYYRLDRIRSLTGTDLGRGATCNDLHAALRIARLAGLVETSGGPATVQRGRSGHLGG